MKNVIKLLMVSLLLVTMISCEDTTKIDYTAPVKINFQGVDDSNTVQVAKGVTSYKATVTINATSKIRKFSLYEANVITGAKGVQIGRDTLFNPVLDSYTLEYTIDNLNMNKAIMVEIEDEHLQTFSKKLLVKITASVIASDLVTIETSEVYYGPYYASWNRGRVYIRSNGEQYKNEIDFSLGNIAITGTDTVPAFISPDIRGEFNLPTMSNLKSTKFELTTLTRANFEAIPANDASIIEALPSPTLTAIKAEVNKVYLYENATEKGLIFVGVLQAKKGTLQQKDDSWLKNQTYHQLKIYTKTVPKN